MLNTLTDTSSCSCCSIVRVGVVLGELAQVFGVVAKDPQSGAYIVDYKVLDSGAQR